MAGKTVRAGSGPGPGPFNPDPLAAKVPLWLPMGFIVVGLVSGLLLTVGAAAFWPEFQFVRLQPRLLALVHLFTLGLGSAVTMGVIYQMAPVVLVTRLHSAGLGWLSLAAFLPGLGLIVASFYYFSVPGLALGAGLTTMGGLLFLYNVWRTWRGAPADNITRRFMLPAVLSFVLTLVFGFLIAASWQLGWRLGPRGVDPLIAHLFLGGAGWFTGIIIGVSYPLIGMFRLAHGHGPRLAHIIFWLLYTGVACGAVSPWLMPVTPWFTGAALLLVTAAIALYLYDLHSLWRRSLRAPDVWMRQVPWSMGYLLLVVFATSGLFVARQWAGSTPPNLILATGTLFALGFVGTLILALLHKIVPFLVWYHRYLAQVGKAKVPLIQDLVSEPRGRMGFLFWHGSLLAAVVTTAAGWPGVARWALAVTAVSFIMLSLDLLQLLRPATEKEAAANELAQA